MYDLAALQGPSNCTDDGLVFKVISTRGNWVPLCKQTVLDVLRAQLTALKLDPSKFAFNSFRHGAIQSAVRVQPSLELLKLQTGHQSDSAFHVYANMPGHERMATGMKMMDAFDALLL